MRTGFLALLSALFFALAASGCDSGTASRVDSGASRDGTGDRAVVGDAGGAGGAGRDGSAADAAFGGTGGSALDGAAGAGGGADSAAGAGGTGTDGPVAADARVAADAARLDTLVAADAATADAPAATLPRPGAAVVSDALATALSSYHRNASTGDIWCQPCNGAPVILAAAAFAGDTSADARLLQQMREVLGGSKDPFGTGGYAANDERNVTAMFAIAKLMPRIWSQLSAAEVHKIDLIMQATLVADIYLTADSTNVSGVPVGFDGDTNHDRDWNPNYREGMIGAVLVGTEYFGGQAPVQAMLDAYDHAAFAAELQAQGLSNLYWTFSTYQRTPAAGAPSPATVEQGIKNYAMHGITLRQLLDMYVYLAMDTFGATVTCGLNDGAGILVGGVYAGRIVAGCAGLPNLGAVGMEKEFDSVDAEGKRSSAGYVQLGVRANLMNQLVLVAYGDWAVTAASTQALRQVNVGVTDFFYKATQGYQGYSHATDEGLFKCGTDMDCLMVQSLWTEILAPAHGL
jgi:hypothetical protein